MKIKKNEFWCNCGEEILPKRKAAGYNNCLKCGEIAARKIAADRNRSVIPMHKSNLIFLGTGDDIKAKIDKVRTMTGKNGT